MYVSERRDRGAQLDPKPRWATVSRPPKALRHIAGKADAKLLTSTRMGDRRSLSAHVNPHTQTLGDACPCCHSAIDTAPHMLQCPAVKSDLRVQEALQQLKASMVGRPIRMRGSGDVELGLLVDFVAASHLNTGAEQVLLGSCSSQAVPPNLRNMYTKKMKMEIFRRSIKPNRGMRLRMGVAWSMVSMIQEPMQGMEGMAEGTQCHCRTCARRPF